MDNRSRKASTSRRKSMIPGQQTATIEELEKEIKKARDEEEMFLVSSLQNSLFNHKELPPAKKREVGCQLATTMLQIGNKTQSLELVEDLLKLEQPIDETNIQLKHLRGKILAEQNLLCDGYYCLLRAAGNCIPLKEQGIKFEQLDSDLKLYTEKVGQVKNFPDYIYVSGSGLLTGQGNNNVNLAPILQLRGRIVRSIACGSNHMLALVESCFCSNPFNPKPGCPGTNVCNGGLEIFGWGDNSAGQICGKTQPKYIDTPAYIESFSGKGIIGLAASLKSSAAFDSNGEIYEWGVKENSNCEIEKNTILGKLGSIKYMLKGAQYNICCLKNNQAIIWGRLYGATSKDIPIQIFNYTKPQPLTAGDSNSFKAIAAGDNHIVVLTQSGSVLSIGNNEFGQLGQNDSDILINQFQQIEFFKDQQVTHISATEKCTFFATSQGKVYYSGMPSKSKKSNIPKEMIIQNGAKLVQFVNIGNHYQALSDQGQVYQWSPESIERVVLNDKIKDFVANKIIGAGDVILLTRKLIKPEYCTAEIGVKFPKTYSPILMNFSFSDEFENFPSQILFPIRVMWFITDKKNIKLEEIQTKVNDRYEQNKQKYVNKEVYCEEISIEQSQKYKGYQQPGIFNCFTVEFQMMQSEEYYLWYFVNEKPIKNNPITINLNKSQEEEKHFQAACKKEEIRTKQQQAEIQKEQEKIDQKINNLFEKEFHDNRENNTMKRANQVFENHMAMVQAEKKSKEIEKKIIKESKGLGGTGGKINKNKMEDLKKIYGYKDEKKSTKQVTSIVMANQYKDNFKQFSNSQTNCGGPTIKYIPTWKQLDEPQNKQGQATLQQTRPKNSSQPDLKVNMQSPQGSPRQDNEQLQNRTKNLTTVDSIKK